MKKYWVKRYLNIFVFSFVISFIVMLLLSLIIALSFMTISLMMVLLGRILIFSLSISFIGLLFVSTEHYSKYLMIKELEKSANMIDEPFRSKILRMIQEYKYEK